MTRKDYVLVAEHLAKGWPVEEAHRSGYSTAILRVADAFAADNGRFDRERFLTAAHDFPVVIR